MPSDFTHISDLLAVPLEKRNLKVPMDAARLCKVLQSLIESEFPESVGKVKVLTLTFKTRIFTIRAPSGLAHKITLQTNYLQKLLHDKTGTKLAGFAWRAGW